MSIFSERELGIISHRQFLFKLRNSSSITRRLQTLGTLNVHCGCVNTIAWNDDGSTILSGSDDQHLIVTDPFTSEVLVDVHSGHRENIFSAKFLPGSNDRRVVSCSGDGVVFHTDFDRTDQISGNVGCFTCHGASTAYEVRVFPNTPNLFLSCSDDCTVRLYDLRTKSQCMKDDCLDDILIRSKWGITSMDINPMNPNEIVCGCSDSSVRVYDHRKLSTQAASNIPRSSLNEASIRGLVSRFVLMNRKERRPPRITSVVYNRQGTEILSSYSSESLYLLDPKQSISQQVSQTLLADHRNQKKSKLQSDPVSQTEQSTRSSQFKRLRLRGDWSDTGPDSRPSNEPASAGNSNSTQTSSGDENRAPQNVFMQRMSDILTQLVNRTSTNSSSARTTSEIADATPSQSATETSASEETASNSTGNADHAQPIIGTPTPTSLSSSSGPETGSTPSENAETSQTRPGFLNMLFGRNQQTNQDEDETEDTSTADEDDEEETNQSSNNATAAETSTRFRSGRFRTTRWDRLMQRRERERQLEEDLLKTIPSLGLINSFEGHRNARTMIKEANFWSESYVMSGSDCGHIFIWNKFTGKIVRIINADRHVVNCVQPHPLEYPILASSGIDYNIKLFSPTAETPIDDTERIHNAVKRNHKMLEESSSTITVPAAFMIRMLTSLYRPRRTDDTSGTGGNDDEDEDSAE